MACGADGRPNDPTSTIGKRGPANTDSCLLRGLRSGVTAGKFRDMGRQGCNLSMFGAAMAAASFVAVGARAEPEAPEWLQPTSKWEVEYADEKCRLLRRFGQGDTAIVLEIERSLTLDAYTYGIYGKSMPAYSDFRWYRIEFAPQKFVRNVPAWPFEVPGRTEKTIKFDDQDGAISRAMQGDQRVRISGRQLDLRLQLGDIQPAIKALEKCHDDLLASWGIDPDDARAIKQKPKPRESHWIYDEDYPSAERKQRNEGIVTYLLTVSEKGKTTSCRTLHSSGFPNLDKATCDLMLRRSSFYPARDAAGNAAASYYANHFTWQIPK